MSFYITLPSNSSSEVFKNNTKSNYITKLARPISLEGNWEVALTKMIYIGNSFIHNISHEDEVGLNEAFFIYSDIIEDQIIGDTNAKLLETLAIKGSSINEAISIDIKNLNYVPLSKTEFSSIEINIKDSIGEDIRFSNYSKVILKLHFRPKKYEFF